MTNPEHASPESIATYRGQDRYDRDPGVSTWFLDRLCQEKLGSTALADVVVEGSPAGEKILKTTSGSAPTEAQVETYSELLAVLKSEAETLLITPPEYPSSL